MLMILQRGVYVWCGIEKSRIWHDCCTLMTSSVHAGMHR